MPVYEVNLWEECSPDPNQQWETQHDGSIYWELVHVLLLFLQAETLAELTGALRRLRDAIEADRNEDDGGFEGSEEDPTDEER
jgi:hypothetical protein